MERPQTMAKLDITNVPRELDELIKASSSPRHRHILENVRRHYLLELTGRIDEMLAPDMTVEEPVYYINVDGSSRTLRGRDEVRALYKEMEGVVFAREETAHAVTDAGYWSESRFNFYLPGPDGWVLKRQWIAMRWAFDEHARLIGEHVYEHADSSDVVPIDAADVITFVEACQLLQPLIRPIAGSGGDA